MPNQLTNGPAVAIHMYQALYGMAPSNALYNSYVSQASANPSGFASDLTSSFALTTDSALALQVLNNLGVTAATVNAASYAAVLSALEQVFTGYGVASRGQIILNLTSILGNLEGDATYGAAATAFNAQAFADFTYATNAANTVPSVVAPADPAVGQTFLLTTGLDAITGTGNNDTFIGVDDGGPSTTITLGDNINGGLGIDTLKIFSANDNLNLGKMTVSSIEKLHVINSLSDWDNIDIAGLDFKEILLDVGGRESGGLNVANVLSTSAVTLTNIEADDEDNYINFKTDSTSTEGNISVTVSNVDMSSDYEYFHTYSAFTAATTVNTTVNLSNIDDKGNGDDGGYYHYLDTGTITGVNVNATFNVTNVVNADEFEVEFNVTQAGGSVNNITVNLTNTDNVDVDLRLDDAGNGTSKNDVVTLNLTGVKNSDGHAQFYTTDAETFNVNVLTDSELDAIGNYYNDDGSPMGNVTVNLNATGNLKVGFWDLNDDAGVTENTAFNITGAGNVTINQFDDGNSNITVNASTATGNITLLDMDASVISVTTNTGNDHLQLGGFKTAVSTGEGDDTVDINGYDYGNVLAKTINGGIGTDTIVINDGALLTAALAAKVTGFEVLDVTGAFGGDTYDMSKMASLTAVTAKGNLGAVTISNAAAGTTVRLTSAASSNSTVDALTYALKTATGTSDNFSLSLNASDTEKKVGDKDGQLTVSAVTANAIESFSISSNATTTDGLSVAPFTLFTAKDYTNTISSLTGDAVKTVTLTGAANLTITDVTAMTLTKVDASAMTGKLNIVLDASANAGAVAVLGGSGADTIDMTGNTAVNNIIVGGGGADKITLAVAGTKETVRIATDTDSVLTLKDITVPVVTPVVFDTATGFDTIINFTSGEDKIELSSALGLAMGDARSAIAGKVTIGDGDISTNAELAGILQTLFGTGVGFFNDGAANRAVSTVVIDDVADYMMVFIDTDADGNWTNGVDQAIKLSGVTELLITDIVFG